MTIIITNVCYVLFSPWNIECELLSPEECKQRCPILNIEGVKGGLWIPEDGVGDPYEICQSLISEAQNTGLHMMQFL